MSISSRGNGKDNGKHVCSFTLTEQKIMNALIDQKPHSRKDLVYEIGEGDWSDANLHAHLTKMRRKLPPGHEIICQVEGRVYYYRYIVSVQ